MDVEFELAKVKISLFIYSSIKGTLSLNSSNHPCYDGNVRFKTVTLKTFLGWSMNWNWRFQNFKNIIIFYSMFLYKSELRISTVEKNITYLTPYLHIYPLYYLYYLSICLSIYLSINIFVYSSIYLLFIYLSAYLFIYISICLSIYLSIYLFIYLSRTWNWLMIIPGR